MAGISLSLDGDKIQINFQKDDESTAIIMDAGAARTLVSALSQLLDVIGSEEEGMLPGEEAGEEIADEDLLDVTSPSIDIGLDEAGQAVVALQAGPLPPFMLRLKDDEARHIAESLLEILNSPRDVRTSQGSH